MIVYNYKQTIAIVQGRNKMEIKLFDSELKVMEVLWKEGDLPAKDISQILGDKRPIRQRTDIYHTDQSESYR